MDINELNEKFENRYDELKDKLDQLYNKVTNGLTERSIENTKDIKELHKHIEGNNIESVKHRAFVTNKLDSIDETISVHIKREEGLAGSIKNIETNINTLVRSVLLGTIGVLGVMIMWLLANSDIVIKFKYFFY